MDDEDFVSSYWMTLRNVIMLMISQCYRMVQ